MTAEVGGYVRGVIAKEVVGEEGLSRGLACCAPLQRPCVHRTAGSRATWEGAFTKVERAKAPLAYRRHRVRGGKAARCAVSVSRAPALLPLILRMSLLAEMAVCNSHCADFCGVFFLKQGLALTLLSKSHTHRRATVL